MARGLFIVSTGRTGTSFLQTVFEEAGALALHEPGPASIRRVAHRYASGHLSDERAAAILREVRGPQLADAGPERPYVESSTLVYALIGPILDTFDDVEVVHIVRNPLTYVRSGKNWGQYRFLGRVRNLVPYRRLAPPQLDPWSLRARVHWMFEDQFDRLCWAWTNMNRVVREQGEARTAFRSVRFEDLVDPQVGPIAIRSLLRLVGLDLEEERIRELSKQPVNQGRRSSFPAWQQWPAKRIRQLVETCREEAARYGYDLDAQTASALDSPRPTRH